MNTNIVETRNDDDRTCMICGNKEKRFKLISINRRTDGQNIITFGCCNTCMRKLGDLMVSESYKF